MFSSEGEKVDFSQAISTSAARGAVEKWLLQVEEVMTVSIKDVIQSAKEVRIENSDLVGLVCFIFLRGCGISPVRKGRRKEKGQEGRRKEERGKDNSKN